MLKNRSRRRDTETMTLRDGPSRTIIVANPAALADKLRTVNKLREPGEADVARSEQSLHEFAHAAAHDLRAPIHHISARVEKILAEHGDELSDEVTTDLEQIEKSVTRMRALLDRLIAYADLGAELPPFEAVGLGPIFEDLQEEFKDAIAGTKATVHVDDLPAVYGSPTLLRQLFQKLLGNALKYRRSGVAPNIEILSEVDEEAGQCHISVVDNGIGFDPAHADRLLEPFHRLVTRGAFEGSGVGMAIAKRIVELHGGAISVWGKQGHGAVFTVRLPAARR